MKTIDHHYDVVKYSRSITNSVNEYGVPNREIPLSEMKLSTTEINNITMGNQICIIHSDIACECGDIFIIEGLIYKIVDKRLFKISDIINTLYKLAGFTSPSDVRNWFVTNSGKGSVYRSDSVLIPVKFIAFAGFAVTPLPPKSVEDKYFDGMFSRYKAILDEATLL